MANRLYKAGFAGTDTPADLRCLAAAATGGGNRYDTLRNAGSNYQVPVGKTLYIGRICYSNGSAGGTTYIGYGDTAVTDSATPPTNPVIVTSPFAAVAAATLYAVDILAIIPAGKYPFQKDLGGTSSCTYFAIEV